MRKFFFGIFTLVLVIAFAISPAEARHKRKRYRAPPPAVEVNIDISSQSMSVYVNGWPYGFWDVSTAREGYYTPRGSFRVTRTAKVYYSKKYDNAPMPNSVFFYGGFAIHGTGSTRALGRPASHGCVRLHPANAARLYELVQEYGPRQTRITLTN
jgi:lipoprotein-anchoring transpeptidase ErfK/SrfK